MVDSTTQHEQTQEELRQAKETIRVLVIENRRLRSELVTVSKREGSG